MAVPGLTGAQFVEESDEVCEVRAAADGVGEQRETFVAARLDAGRGDATVDWVVGLEHEGPCVVVAVVGQECVPEVRHVLEDATQMVRLLLGEAGEAQHDARPVAVLLQEVERRGRSLLLAVCMVGEECGGIVECSVGPTVR